MLVGFAVIVLSLGLAGLIAFLVLSVGLRVVFRRARTLVRRLASRRVDARLDSVGRRQAADRRT